MRLEPVDLGILPGTLRVQLIPCVGLFLGLRVLRLRLFGFPLFGFLRLGSVRLVGRPVGFGLFAVVVAVIVIFGLRFLRRLFRLRGFRLVIVTVFLAASQLAFRAD